MSRSTYSPSFREEIARKVLMRGDCTIAEMATELHVPYHSVRKWIRNPKLAEVREEAGRGEKRAAEWSAEQRLQALLETYALNEEERTAWCRARGVFAHQLAEWKAQCCAPVKSTVAAGEVRTLKAERDGLQREIRRKDRALAEAAALLVLQKKVQALWEDEAK
jgi:transposase-like protein